VAGVAGVPAAAAAVVEEAPGEGMKESVGCAEVLVGLMFLLSLSDTAHRMGRFLVSSAW
jgi:hypothetical protein